MNAAADSSSPSTFQQTVNGIRFNCRVEGRRQGPWLVLSNSLATNLSMWDGQIARWAGSYRILRYDQRGHGGTNVLSESCTFDELIDDVVGLFRAFGIESAAFAGVSMGGITGLGLAARYPRLIDRLVACDCPWVAAPGTAALWEERIAAVRTQGMHAMVQPTIQRWFRPAFLAANSPVLERVRGMIATTLPAGYIACANALQNFDYREASAAITVPTLLVVGAHDGVLPQTMREMQQAIRGSQFVEIAEAGHLPNVEQPEAFERATAKFLQP